MKFKIWFQGPDIVRAASLSRFKGTEPSWMSFVTAVPFLLWQVKNANREKGLLVTVVTGSGLMRNMVRGENQTRDTAVKLYRHTGSFYFYIFGL